MAVGDSVQLTPCACIGSFHLCPVNRDIKGLAASVLLIGTAQRETVEFLVDVQATS